MTTNSLVNLKNFLTIIFIALLLALAAFSFSLWQTPSYKSTIKLLAVFNQSDIDTYTASKTANYITGIMNEVIYSDSFINSVYKNDGNLIDNLGQGSEIRQKNWGKTVKTQVLDSKGIMIIDVYGNDKSQTNLLASNIGEIIINQHGLYDGSQNRVNIKMIDVPSIYESWSGNKILTDTGLGFLAGILIGFTLIVIFPGHKLFDFKKKNRIRPNFPAAKNYQSDEPLPLLEPIRQVLKTEFEPANSDSGNQSDIAQSRMSNPWLDQYYEENLLDRNNNN